jgi:hypothetical protein
MASYCTKCRAPLKGDERFCIKCGAKIEDKAIPTQSPAPQQASTAPSHVPPTAKRSKTGLIIGIVAIVVAIVIILLVVFFVLGGGRDSRLIGTWEYEVYMGYSIEYIFNDDGSFEFGGLGQTMKVGIWNTNENQLCLEVTNPLNGMDLTTGCINYSIVGNKLTLSEEGYDIITLTKT